MLSRKVLFVGGMLVGIGIGMFTSPMITSTGEVSGAESENLVDSVSSSVVGILNIQQGEEGSLVEHSTGSGVIYKVSDGNTYIFTNHHVVEGANLIEISLGNGEKYEGELLGSDKISDLAVVKVDSSDIGQVATLGNSEYLERGKTVYAIGSPLGMDFYGTVTRGIISATSRVIPVDLDEDGIYDYQSDVIQTDAAINPGNSGGALVNTDGEVIGINSTKIVEEGVEGIGLAIPITVAKPLIESLEMEGKIIRPYMGVEIESVWNIGDYYQHTELGLPQDVVSGVCLTSVQEGTPADTSGLEMYDVVTEIDGVSVGDVTEFRKVLYEKSVGEGMELTLYRDGKVRNVEVKLGEQV